MINTLSTLLIKFQLGNCILFVKNIDWKSWDLPDFFYFVLLHLSIDLLKQWKTFFFINQSIYFH